MHEVILIRSSLHSVNTLQKTFFEYLSTNFPEVLARTGIYCASRCELNKYAQLCMALGLGSVPLAGCAQTRSIEDLFVNIQQIRHAYAHLHELSLRTIASMVEHSIHMAEVLYDKKAADSLTSRYDLLDSMAQAALEYTSKAENAIVASFHQKRISAEADLDAMLCGVVSVEQRRTLNSQHQDNLMALHKEEKETTIRGNLSVRQAPSLFRIDS